MAISPYSAAVSPKTIALSIWASTIDGFTTGPQSTAHTTRCTFTAPSDATDTSATSATWLSNALYTAMPRARPAGGAVPQPALLAARLSAPRWRGALLSRSRRYSYGSFLAAWASSSMNDSTANALYELFTDRQKPTGIPVSVRR